MLAGAAVEGFHWQVPTFASGVACILLFSSRTLLCGYDPEASLISYCCYCLSYVNIK